MKKIVHLKDLDINERIILKCILKFNMCDCKVESTDLVQDLKAALGVHFLTRLNIIHYPLKKDSIYFPIHRLAALTCLLPSPTHACYHLDFSFRSLCICFLGLFLLLTDRGRDLWI
jgi:hypothetical protein